MKRGALITIALAALFAVASTAGAEPPAWRGGHDIGELMALAEEHYDLERTDAVFLLDALSITLHEDGTRETTVHRIVWISTELVSDTYADLRVPYDGATSTLTVHALRTWRDGRWWPHESEVSPTAVVETTPGALIRADDYTTIRETMLLHDGVEIPCIVETAYTITESRDPGVGADGLWVVPRDYPSVRLELSITPAEGDTLRHRERNGAAGPEIVAEGGGRETYRWTAYMVPRLERPLIRDAASYAPHVEWTTWESQGAFRDALATSLEEAMVLSDALRDTVAKLVEHEPVDLTRARAVADYINESTRSIHYDDSFWELSPRTALRTWETAYGHRLDRAVLAAALFREAGLKTLFVYRSAGYADEPGDDFLGLGRCDGIAVWVTGRGVDAYYDPEAGSLDLGETELYGRSMWFAGDTRKMFRSLTGHQLPSTYELIATLEPADEGNFTGEGFVNIKGGLAPYDRVVGLDGECGDYLEDVAGSAASGATINEHSVVRIHRDQVVAGFEFDIDAPEPDDQGRIELAVGDPTGGVLDRLPPDVHLYSATRGSPLALLGPMSQKVTLRLRIGESEAARLPEPRSLENSVGRFSLTVVEEDDWVTVTRELAIGDPEAKVEPWEAGPMIVAPDQWPELRELLLEETDRANRSVFLR